MRTRLAVLLLALAVAPAWAYNAFYDKNDQSVTDVHAVVTFGFPATQVTIASCPTVAYGGTTCTSTNGCYFKLAGTAAATSTGGTYIPPGAVFTYTFNGKLGGDGWSTLGVICASGQTATFQVHAAR
jgi:hypothetical protein